ncbi:hypothetical protein SBRY_60319 [Actinacidiphila bryophytorum]|uniref:Uncharacterized protein n=1 Tax=Actinacidiphila bryophytorum TaxID=1436133 RepID=A0A9W4MEW7_9ACTN|nr:hypothetical protein SBRY_60319 [Actinacidiphila bryophytorum]
MRGHRRAAVAAAAHRGRARPFPAADGRAGAPAVRGRAAARRPPVDRRRAGIGGLHRSGGERGDRSNRAGVAAHRLVRRAARVRLRFPAAYRGRGQGTAGRGRAPGRRGAVRDRSRLPARPDRPRRPRGGRGPAGPGAGRGPRGRLAAAAPLRPGVAPGRPAAVRLSPTGAPHRVWPGPSPSYV